MVNAPNPANTAINAVPFNAFPISNPFFVNREYRPQNTTIKNGISPNNLYILDIIQFEQIHSNLLELNSYQIKMK